MNKSLLEGLVKISSELSIKIFLVVFVCFIFNKQIIGQTNYLDSLKAIIETGAENNDKVMGLCELGNVLIDSNASTALLYYKDALELSEKLDWDRGKAEAYIGIGTVYRLYGNYNDGHDYFMKGLLIMEDLEDKKGMADCMIGMATIYVDMRNFEKAIAVTIEAIALYEEVGEERNMIRAYTILGVSYGWLHQPKLQMDCHYAALRIAEKYKDSVRISQCLIGIADAYLIMDEFEIALEYAKRSLQIAKRTKKKDLIASNYAKIGHIMLSQENFNGALKSLDTALAIATDVQSKIDIQDISEYLYITHYRLGNYKESVDYLIIFHRYKDAISGEKTRNYIAELGAKYESEKARQKIELQSLRLSRNNYLIVGLTALILMMGFIGLLIIRQFRLKNKRKSLESMELKQKLFRAQINPHFLFNALNSIQKYILSGDRKNAHQYIGKFSVLIRSVLENSNQTYIPIKDELNALQLYLEIERVRVNEKFDFSIIGDTELDTYNTDMPAMLLQPFVENSIWHGIMNMQGKGRIEVKVEKIPAGIHISIEDNGVGREKARQIADSNRPNHKSLGMKLIDDWIATLNSKDTSRRTEINIEDLYDDLGNPRGTRINILLYGQLS